MKAVRRCFFFTQIANNCFKKYTSLIFSHILTCLYSGKVKRTFFFLRGGGDLGFIIEEKLLGETLLNWSWGKPSLNVWLSHIHQYLIMGKNCEKNSAELMWTFIKWSTLANSWVLTESLQYSLSPGLATNLWANSLWNISTAHLPKDKKINLLLYLFFYNYISDYNIHVHVYIY